MSESVKHPIQPISIDTAGILRFKNNPIVRFLLESSPYNLHDLACMGFADNDFEQLEQLIGYSVDGFLDLDFVSDETRETVEAMAIEILPERGLA